MDDFLIADNIRYSPSEEKTLLNSCGGTANFETADFSPAKKST
ncbi:hypothetical protein C8N25_12818 [Algoriphagus antarcticus]|uniref:Uncharacterized protein n=1 Tax=Algoriphagus antarcticus TaxID=238540 RepID=A0A3E0DIE6_9BACT|nr:hypothetical protein C8N25_12818 [Algoriphagus antarcticus]